MRYEPGALAFSRAGHDKDGVFIIWKECGEYVYLVNGSDHSVGKPKRKNKKHVQITHMRDDSISERLKQGGTVTDEEVRHFIRRCIREIRDCPGGTEYV